MTASSGPVRVPVLIVGGGPVGLSMALLLERSGVDCLVAEQNPTTTTHPKSRGLTVRTMEIFRVWGIDEAVRAGGLGADADVMIWCEALVGPLVGMTHPEPAVASPTSKSMAPQNAVEDGLAGALEGARHADLRRRTEVVSLTQDDEGVTGTLRDLETGEEFEVRAEYAIACDGAGSRTRQALGIEMDGPDALASFASHYYSADLSHLPYMRTSIGYFVRPSDPAKRTFELLASNVDCDRFLYLQRLVDDDDQPLTEEELADLVREQLEMPDLKVERMSVLRWRMGAEVARSFRSGRVFLAGDVAHRLPPAGGMGLNSGVADVHNLAWKLVLVLRGIADVALLDTYEVERRPVAESNTTWSTGNFARLARATEAFRHRREDPMAWRAAVLDLDNHLNSTGQGMGYLYERGAVVDDGSPILPLDPRYWPTDRPGARFPHLWVDVAWTESTIDWFDRDFVLVCGPKAKRWQEAGAALVRTTDAPLVVRTLAALAAPFEIEPDGAVLVRPDGHVAWRSPSVPEDPEADLRSVVDFLLAGGTEATTR